MVSDQPDYTRTITVNVELAESLRVFASKAEAATKLSKTEMVPCPAEFCTVVPSDGKKVGLILVSFSVRNGGYVDLQVYKDTAWTDLIDELDVAAGVPAVLPMYCWEPEMDVGNGTDARVRLVGPSGANKSGFILYYEYTPAS